MFYLVFKRFTLFCVTELFVRYLDEEQGRCDFLSNERAEAYVTCEKNTSNAVVRQIAHKK